MYWNISDLKNYGFVWILYLFLVAISLETEIGADSTFSGRRCQIFLSQNISRWLFHITTCSGLFTRQKHQILMYKLFEIFE